MAEEIVETPDLEETHEEEVVEEEKVELTKAEVDELRQKAGERDEFEKKNKQLFERAKKNTQAEKDGLSNKDLLFLAKTDIHEDDIEEVQDWAKFKKVSISEAYKQLKGTLDIRNEERKTADATSTKPGARGTTKTSPADVLSKAERGEVIETDEGMRDLFKARIDRKLNRNKK